MKIRKLFLIFGSWLAAIFLATLFLGVRHEYVSAQTPSSAKSAVCTGVSITSGGSDGSCNDAPGSAGIDGVIKLAVNILSVIVGIVAVVMIIVGGLKYVTSQGEASNTAGAKNTILYAIIGLIVVALAQLIVRFTLNKAGDAQCAGSTHLQSDGTCR